MDILQKVKDVFGKYTFVCLLAVNVLFIALSVWLLPFGYESSDDRILAWNTSGYLTGHPRFHLIWTHVFYAWIQSRLYMMLPAVEWWSWSLLVVHLLGLSVIGYCVLSANHNRWAKGLIIAMVYVWEMYGLTHFQFTTTAGLAAISGMLLILSRKRYGWGILLFVLGALIRYQAAMFTGLMVAALYPFVLARDGFDRKQVAVMAICAISAFCLNLVDTYLYERDPRLKEMREYDNLRSKMYDNSNWWRVYDRPPAGLSRSELFVTSYPVPFVTDSVWDRREAGGFNTVENMKLFLQAVDELTTLKGVPKVKKAKNIPVQFRNGKVVFFSILALTVIVGCFWGCRNNKERLALVFGLLCFVLAMAYISLDQRLVPRACLCGLFPLLWVPLCLVSYEKKVTRVFAFLALFLTGWFFVKALPSTKPSRIYESKKELVECGVEHGGKYLYSTVSNEIEYPLGLRLRGVVEVSPYAPLPFSKKMLEESTSMLLGGKNTQKWEWEKEWLMSGIEKNYGLMIETEETCRNEKYVMFRMCPSTHEGTPIPDEER